MSDVETIKDVHKRKVEIPVTGMSCAACSARIQENLSEMQGVESASVNLSAERATVIYDPLKVNVDDFLRMIKELGYGAVVSKQTIPIKGMSCAACVQRVQDALSSLDGVIEASVNFATEKATIEYIPSQVGIREFRRIIRDAGYDIVSAEKGEDIVEKEKQERWLKGSQLDHFIVPETSQTGRFFYRRRHRPDIINQPKFQSLDARIECGQRDFLRRELEAVATLRHDRRDKFLPDHLQFGDGLAP